MIRDFQHIIQMYTRISYSYRYATALVGSVILTLLCANIANAGGFGIQQKLDESEIIRELSIGNAHVWQAKVNNNSLALVLHKRDTSVAVVYDRDGVQRFRYAIRDSVMTQIQGVSVSEDANTILVRELIENEWYRTRVFDYDGNELFSIQSGSGLLTSSKGERFCSLSPADEAQPFRLYDRSGQIVIEYPKLCFDGWRCVFVGDSLLLVITAADTLLCLNASTGSILWSQHLEFTNRSHLAVMIYSSEHDVLLIHKTQLMYAITLSGSHAWRRQFSDRLHGMAIDPVNPHVAIQLYSLDGPVGITEIISIENGRTLSASLRSNRDEVISYSGNAHLRFYDGLLVINGPTSASPLRRFPRIEYWTRFITFDHDEGELRMNDSIWGSHYLISINEKSANLLRLNLSGNAEIVVTASLAERDSQ